MGADAAWNLYRALVAHVDSKDVLDHIRQPDLKDLSVHLPTTLVSFFLKLLDVELAVDLGAKGPFLGRIFLDIELQVFVEEFVLRSRLILAH